MQLWVTEEEKDLVRVSYAVEETLFSQRSDFQLVEVVETKAYGRMLLIDGLVMLTDRDEFVYHEMISHVPALLHQKPRKAVVIGGGDGGTVRELLKHPEIEEITLCEIDRLVIDACQEFFPKVASGFADDRVDIVVGDGVAYADKLQDSSVDLFIVDSTDPISVGEGLFSSAFYKNVARCLRPGGLMACQSESPWLEKQLHQRIQKNVSSSFKCVKPYLGAVPTYPRGYWSWTLGANHEVDPSDFDRKRLSGIIDTLSYLNADVLPAAFALPGFFLEKLK